ncbi:related to sphingosine-1-phosphate lyase [Cephalotrichum gorgonifer]|uniref:GPI inositol-deacylase n=1 Tax=Cephalotrichum gorgonifer TaxID=2041049 RepID=A0AAE8MY49_9PEZI|nr:related to sphingosine-1-phosphate lyase [Cephalotrichum gorgonifer]
MNDRLSLSSDEADGTSINQDQSPEPRDGRSRSNKRRSHLDRPLPPSSTRSRRTANSNGRASQSRNGLVDDRVFQPAKQKSSNHHVKSSPFPHPASDRPGIRRGPWFTTASILLFSLLGLSLLGTVLYSLHTRQLDPNGCRMSYMRPSYIEFSDFDTEHTRFASKYSLYLYREQGVGNEKLKGVPVLFVPGNAGSYKQVRPIAAEASNYFNNVLRHDENALAAGAENLDFFTVDFNEDITAFHGQTLLDQAEYVNEAVRYILSLYMDPRRSPRRANVPDPTSVIVLGHSMGGVVARTALVIPDYQAGSVNTIITMSAPHSQPPVTFDGQIVQIYDMINTYWRKAYAQTWTDDNPLSHVTLISIAGGGLDTVVPSDYASVESFVPETHGFTVFTTSIPTVWTSMDHQAILWCDQFRKVVTRALYDVVDVHRASQTKPRGERMRIFKKHFLTGMEANAEKSLPHQTASTILTLGDGASTAVPSGERLVIREFGREATPRAYLLPVPPPESPRSTHFTLLSDTPISHPAEGGNLEVLLCSIFAPQPQEATTQFSVDVDLSVEGSASVRLTCKDAASDLILLPQSTKSSSQPFSLDYEQKALPFSYLQYDAEILLEHQFVVVLDRATTPKNGFVLAEFADRAMSTRTRNISLWKLVAFGTMLRLPPSRPTVSQIRIPAVESSLLAYHLEVGQQKCGENQELFAPLVRQYLSRPYESKFFVNARNAEISIHGVSPFVPPPLETREDDRGLGLQFWTDPTCGSEVVIKLRVDVLGSLGKLYMRYRTVFAAFPLLIVVTVLGKQFRTYDKSGIFIPFAEGLDLCLRRLFPVVVLCLTLVSVSGWRRSSSAGPGPNAVEAVDFYQNDSFTGTDDPFFWFLLPLIGTISVGVCAGLHYALLLLTQVFAFAFGLLARPVAADEKLRAGSPAGFSPSSPRRRMITTAVLLILVSTFIPYQFAYLVVTLVQLITTVRALRMSSIHRQTVNYNFYNYTHSILLLMLWVLPINLPILAVWLRNLAAQWLTPFSSHHNVLSIMSFILLVENMTTGRMIPRVTNRLRHVTTALFACTALYAGVYGISYAYQLHHLVHLISTWLVLIYLTSSTWSHRWASDVLRGHIVGGQKRGKTP